MIVRALMNPATIPGKLKRYGVGRIILDTFKQHPSIATRLHDPIRAGKIAADLPGYLRRRRMADRIKATSRYADYFPEATAFRAAPPGTFPEVDAAVDAARAVYRRYLDSFPQGQPGRSFAAYILNNWDKEASGDEDNMVTDLSLFPEFYPLATAQPFVDMAAGYLGEFPILGNIGLQIVFPNDKVEGFQRFHIDRISNRQLKIFIAVEDVDEGNGATMVLPADQTLEVREKIGYRRGRIEDDVVHAATPLEQLLRAKGPAGTTFLFDPCRVIHAGARARTRHRILLMLQYISKYAHVESNLQRGLIRFDRAVATQSDASAHLFNLK
jgi:hypothetical protein